MVDVHVHHALCYLCQSSYTLIAIVFVPYNYRHSWWSCDSHVTALHNAPTQTACVAQLLYEIPSKSSVIVT